MTSIERGMRKFADEVQLCKRQGIMSHEDERQEQTNSSGASGKTSASSSSPDRPSSSSSAAAAAASSRQQSSRPAQQQHRRSDSVTKTPKHRNIHHAAGAIGDGRPKVTVPAGAENLLGLFSPPLAGAAADGDNADERDSGDAAAAAAPI